MSEEASPKRNMAAGMPPVSFREVNGRQKALVSSVMDRCENLKVRFEKELEEFKEDEGADKNKVCVNEHTAALSHTHSLSCAQFIGG